MLQAWLSIGYIVLLAILVLGFILWRSGVHVLAIAALVVGIPLWFGWEYARPTWTTGVITGTEVRRSDPDRRGNTTDIEYIFMRNRSDRGLELTNDDFWWWLKRNSERVFNDAKTAQDRNTEVTLMWNWWRSTLFSLYPNVIAIWPRWLMAIMVGASHHLLRPLPRSLARLFLHLLQAPPMECARCVTAAKLSSIRGARRWRTGRRLAIRSSRWAWRAAPCRNCRRWAGPPEQPQEMDCAALNARGRA